MRFSDIGIQADAYSKLRQFLGDNLVVSSENTLDQLVPKLLLNGYTARALAALLDRRPELELTKICSRCVDVRYQEVARLALARDKSGCWLWPDINSWAGLPYNFVSRKVNRLGVVGIGGVRLFSSLSSLVASRAAELSEDDATSLVRIFGSARVFPELREFLGVGGSLEILLWMQSLRGADGRHIGWRPRDAADVKRYLDSGADSRRQLLEALSYRTVFGRGVFCYLEDLLGFLWSNSSIKDLRRYAELCGPNGRLNGYEIALCARFSQDISSLSATEMTAWPKHWKSLNAYICAQLMDGWYKFRNDGRPKALLLLAIEDFRDGGLAILDHCHNWLNFGAEFDVKVVGSYDRDGLLEELSNIPEDLSLLIFAFHGAKEYMELSRDLGRYGLEYLDRELRVGDGKLKSVLGRIPRHCRVAMISCLTAHGGEQEANLASYIGVSSGGHSLLAARTKMTLASFWLESRKPFEFSFEGDSPGTTVYLSPEFDSDIPLRPFRGEPLGDEDFGRWARPLESHAARRVFQNLWRISRIDSKAAGSKGEKLWQQVLSYPDASEFDRIPEHHRKSLTHYGFIFGRVLGEPWCPVFGRQFDEVLKTPWDFLREIGYRFVETPCEGDLVIYLAADDGVWKACDFGLVSGRLVLRKAFHALLAPINYCPGWYSHVLYMRRSAVLD
jgi:hypothetical protein